MGSLILKLRTWWETADRTQRVVTAFGSVFLVVLLLGTVYFASKPKMEVLLRDLSPSDQGMVVNELTKLGIPMEYDRSGSILVPANRVAEAQAQLAVKQKLPASGHPGYSDLGQMGAMNTPSVERERIKSTVEGELARSIESISGVSAARVHLTFGEQGPFAREERQPTASVIVSEAAGAPIGPEQARAIQRLVQYAVNGLTPANITVINSQGQTLVDGSTSSSSEGQATARLAAEIAEARRREAALQRKLDIAFGPGNTVASVPVLEMNFDEQSETNIERTPSKAVVVESNEENMEDRTGGVAGPSGIGANVVGAAPTAGGSTSPNYVGKQQALTYETSEKSTKTQKAAGNVVRMAINVIVNSAKIKDVEPVRQAVEGELGPFAKNRANFTYNVTPVEFDLTAQKESEKAAAAAASAARIQQALSVLPILALMVVGFMVVKAISKSSKGSNVLVAALPGGQVVPMGTASQEVLPARTDGSPMQPTQRTAAAAKALQAAVQQEEVAIGAIPDRVNVPLEQIKRMSMEKPEAVAMLLKSWLLDDRR